MYVIENKVSVPDHVPEQQSVGKNATHNQYVRNPK